MEPLPPDAGYYQLLGVSKSASEAEINKAYKKLAIKYHPDKNPSDKELAEENFKKVSEAYEVLSNKEKRQTYDQFGKKGLDSSGMGGGGFSRGQAEEIFAQFFGGQDPFSVLFSQMGEGGMPGGGGMQFAFGGMPGMGPGMGGRGGPGGGPGMAGLPPGFAEMMGGGMGGGGMPGGMGGMGGFPGMMGGGMPGGSRKQPEQPSAIPAGTAVSVHGLQGAAQHNGKGARVESYDAAAGRYTVTLDDGDALKIKFDNLLQLAKCEVTGMQNRAELNGQTATIAGYDAGKQRFHADIQGVGRASLLLSNLILPAGTRGRVFGLTSEAGSKWNDKVGKVLSFDREAGRYLMEMSKSDQLKLKRDNLSLTGTNVVGMTMRSNVQDQD